MKSSCLAASFLLFCVIPAAGAAQVESPAPHEELFGARMQRTMSLLATSTPNRRRPVTILVYGQSISAGLKQSRLEQALREKFPYADITFLNRSISGFSASQLVRSSANDIYPLYPDLVILHDYGVSRIEFERIVENIRRYTTAEILIWTHHIGGETAPERVQNDDEESAVIRYLAQKYNCELVDVREEWRAYLEANHLAPKELLSDNIHQNARGKEVLVGMLLKHFRFNPLLPNDWMRTVRTYEAKRQPDEGASDGVVFTGKPWRFVASSAIGEKRDSALKLTFQGNRVDCVLGPVNGSQAGHGDGAHRWKNSVGNERTLGLYHSLSRVRDGLAARHTPGDSQSSPSSRKPGS